MIKQNIKITVDIVLFTIIDKISHVLLIRRKHEPFFHKQGLPGGFVQDNETLKEAAFRELMEETNISKEFIEILDIYDDIDRDPSARVISVAFVGIVEFEKVSLKARSDVISSEWTPIGEAEKLELAFDHNKILKDAIKFLLI